MKRVKWLFIAGLLLISLLVTSTVHASTTNSEKLPNCSIEEKERLPLYPGENFDPNRIQIGDENAHIYIGAKFKINANINGPESSTGKRILFSGNNPKIATVDDDGVITGVAEGRMLVYVSIEGELNTYRILSVRVFPNKVNDIEACNKPGVKPISFELSQTNPLNLKTHDKVQLYANNRLPENAWDQTIIWESTNGDVAAVDQEGLVKSVMPGEAIIRASYDANPKVYREVRVIVSKRKILINDQKDLILHIGDIKDLVQSDETGFKNPKVSWLSSNNNVVSIIRYGGADITIKAVRQGTATITVHSGTDEEASIKVTVKGNPVLAKTIKLNKSSATVRKGNKLKLKATVGDKNTTNKTVRWSSSNKKIATVDSKGTVTAKGTGSVTITAKTTNDKTAKAKIRVPYEKKLKAGDWTVGKSIPAGRYEVTTQSKSGNLRIYRKGKLIVNVKIGTDTKGTTVKSYTTTLKSGDKIKVLSMQNAEFIKK